MVEDLSVLMTSMSMYYQRNNSSIYSSNSEANASELLEYIEELVSVLSSLFKWFLASKDVDFMFFSIICSPS